jgi:hypothetical protein
MHSIRFNLKNFPFGPKSVLSGLVLLVLLLAGCASGGIFGGGDDDEDYNDDYEDYDRNERISEVRGRVERIDERDSVLYVEPSGVYRSDLRNDDDQIAIHYDDSTEVEYQGKTYEPRALEVGDRIVADVDDSGTRLYARDIEVTYDVTSADRDNDDRYDRDDDRYDRDDDRYDRDDDRYDRDDDADADVAEVRGTVRWLDEDRKVMEIEDASWGWSADRDRDRDDDVVQVHYDSDTVVEYRGKRYTPGNLERGDEVQVEVRDVGSRYLADEITVLASVSD